MKLKLLIIALLFCAGARAQTTPDITPAHLKAAEDLLKVTQADMLFKQNMGTMLKQASTNIPEDKRAKFIEVMNTFVAKYVSWETLRDQMAAAYAKEFTAAELKGLIAFYSTDLGKKLLAKQPALVSKGAEIGQQMVQSHQVELQQMMEAAFKDSK
ncbi:DUF2059 domain-containing protein [Mucilaginibacter achroorhodeus]|uniref:DUF2059 domain-containing protein n=1 Tax=Mucilaginibacter achroorhodeus TaxID=2599294 RepID=A0A563TY76_9SPHI|nr:MULTISPECIES: DUF2059 domain-containing protein [Mucilaginibacter]QXV66130.1 DUF2059 domain-containing protein [Mucilaginibacter sp. 21P]TWR24327.1 DUF2059 domain-containing protein [Mucilaginibacter achroorhodeus]